MTDMTKQEAEEAAAFERKRHVELSRRVHAARVAAFSKRGSIKDTLRYVQPIKDDDNA